MVDDLRFKQEWMRAQLREVAPLLFDIVESLAAHVWAKYGVPVVVTEVYRPARHGNDLHAIWRAVDIRTRDFTREVAIELRDWINDRIAYDSVRPEKYCAIFGDNDSCGNHNDHMHIQVHPRSCVKNF